MSGRPGIQLQADEGPAGVSGGLVADLRRALRGRALVVGVGNPDRGDDGAGPAVVEALRRMGAAVSALEVGDTPERYLGPMADSGTTTVVFVDAVDFGGRPGQAVLLEQQDLPRRSCVTHRSGLGLVMHYLREQAGQHCVLVGVQPASLAPGAGLTAPVATAVDAIAAAIREALGPAVGG
jgi:hydrogenase 3 maturation protease